MIKTREVAKRWGHRESGVAHNCHSDGTKIFSFETCIGEFYDNEHVFINDTSYSPTTSKHQSYMRAAIKPHIVVKHVSKVPKGTQSLIEFYKADIQKEL